MKKFAIILISFFIAFPAGADTPKADEPSYTLKLKDGTVKISLPQGWVQYKPEEAVGKPSAVFIRRKSDGVIEGTLVVGINYLGDNAPCGTKKFQTDYLNKLKEGSAAVDTAASFEDMELLSAPALVINHMGKAKTKDIRELHFVKDCRWYQINFIFERDGFDASWQEIYMDIEKIEFVP